jgi:hypothetical protein
MTQIHHHHDRHLQFPIAVIDFEATALTLSSYPIEVGLAIARSPESALEEWSSLILPDADWDIDAEWDRDAEKLHGISRRDLRNGITPCEAMLTLNQLTAGNAVLWCDGGYYDVHWLAVLSAASGKRPAFVLGDVAAFLRDRPAEAERYRQSLAHGPTPHRAGPDAMRICKGLKAVLEGRSDV